MYLYEKKIIYLSLLEDGMKKASAGFMRISREKDAFVLDIHIKSEGIFFGRKYSLFLRAGSKEIEWGTITGQQGKADAHRCFAVRGGIACLGEEQIEEKDICGILIRLNGQCEISGYWQEIESDLMKQNNPELSAADQETGLEESFLKENSPKEIAVKGIAVKEAPVEKVSVKEGILEEAFLTRRKNQRVREGHLTAHVMEKEGESEEFFPQLTIGDKWEQLLRCYKNVHPFGDERVFLFIEPKDFIVLQAPYQKLVNNSFLLHGFYNYRHMILGPDKELGDRDGSCFYLGVPGTYFEREKMVAIMFGFEGFECNGAVEIGKFGYYMRRVEL